MSDLPNSNKTPQHSSGSSSGPSVRGVAIFLGLGMALTTEVLVACGLGWFVGMWLDKKTGLAPLFMICGIVLFLSASLFHAIRALKVAQRKIEKEE